VGGRGVEGRVALITGAGSGVGRAAALALLGAGWSVVLAGRRQELLEQVAREVAPEDENRANKWLPFEQALQALHYSESKLLLHKAELLRLANAGHSGP